MERVQRIIQKNTNMKWDELLLEAEDSSLLLDQITSVMIERICIILFNKLRERKMHHSLFEFRLQSQIRGAKTIEAKNILGLPLNQYHIIRAERLRERFLQSSIDRHNSEQPEVNPHKPKSKMEMNGVKKPNDFGSEQPTKIPNRSVGYYKNQRMKLFNAIRQGYLGTRRVKFLKEIILINQTMCDEIRESRSLLYLTYRLENELELDNLTKEGGYISNLFLLDQITEIIDEIAEDFFHRDYRKKSENEMLIAMKEH